MAASKTNGALKPKTCVSVRRPRRSRTTGDVKPTNVLSGSVPGRRHHGRSEIQDTRVASSPDSSPEPVQSQANQVVRPIRAVPGSTRGRRDHLTLETLAFAVASPRDLHSEIAATCRNMWQTQEIRIRVSNQAWAQKEAGYPREWRAPLEAAVVALKKQEHAQRLHLLALVREHPLASWCRTAPGLGLAGLGMILASTGRLSRFANVAKLWAYLGMHVIGGRSPRRRAGAVANWSNRGRMTCFQLGEAIVKLKRGKYRLAYARKRAEYLGRSLVGPSGCPLGMHHRATSGATAACISPAGTSAHVHAAAKRYAVKELLKDLWVA